MRIALGRRAVGAFPAATAVGTAAPSGGQRSALTALPELHLPVTSPMRIALGRRAVGAFPAATAVGTAAPPGGQRSTLTALRETAPSGGIVDAECTRSSGGRRVPGRHCGGPRSPVRERVDRPTRTAPSCYIVDADCARP